MFNVAIIPAKGYSSRIPCKNIRLFHGKPILAYSIEKAIESGLFTEVVVSTDSDEVAAIAREYGAEVLMRDSEMTKDEYGPIDIARHHMQTLNADLYCIIYATAPLMSIDDLKKGYRYVRNDGTSFAISVGVEPFLHDAAQFIWCKPMALLSGENEFSERTVMIPIDTKRDCDINTLEDFARAEVMFDALR